MAVSVSTDEGFTVGQPQALFEDSGFALGYDVSADGQRFLAVAPVESADALPARWAWWLGRYVRFKGCEPVEPSLCPRFDALKRRAASPDNATVALHVAVL
jgi:hypothetical protein